MMGTEKDASWDEHWVLYVSDKSLNSAPEPLLHYMLTNLGLNKKRKNQIEKIN